MSHAREVNQLSHHPALSNPISQNIQSKQDFFCFLKKEEKPRKSPPSFSKMGLSQDIIKVTDAEPDICLEVFYALYNVLWPQIENQSYVSLKDSWTNFIGGTISKGILWSPEKLMDDPQEVKAGLHKKDGEKQVFLNLDSVVKSILNLKKELADYPGEILQKEEIMASLELVHKFYLGFRNKVKDLITKILDNNEDSIVHYHALENLLEPKAVMTSDIFSHHWAYCIPRKKAQKMLSLNKWRSYIKSYSDEGSTHRFAAFPEGSEPLVYFKANGGTPLQPEKEFMLYSLYRKLQIPVPETALIILTNVFYEEPDYYYAVQASEAVSGESALAASLSAKTNFEQEAYARQVIGALLTNPSDGSFKNFKYSPKYKTLIGIDNDLVFKPELSVYDGRTINVKSVLYLLSSMDKQIPDSVQIYFRTLDPDLIMLAWLHDLSRKNREYQLLFARLSYQRTRHKYQTFIPESESLSLSDCIQEKVKVDLRLYGGDHESDVKAFYPRISISKNLLKSLRIKLQKIEATFLNNRATSAQILFEEISPILAKYYIKLRLKFQDPETALEALWGENKDRVNYSSVSYFLSEEDLKGFTEREAKEEEFENYEPEELIGEIRKEIIYPLDKLIRRHGERKTKGQLDLQELLKEVQLLKQEGLLESKSFREVVDFVYKISKEEQEIVQEIRSILFNLPQAELQWLLTLEKYFLRAENSPSSVLVLGAFMKQRIFVLTKSEKGFLFDGQGNIKKNALLTGRSSVTCFPEKNPEFYLKQYPEWPGYEHASVSLMRMMGITQLPYQELIIVDHNSRYPVLLTQAVNGDPAFRVWQNPKAFDNLDSFHTGLLIIAAMLMNPEDGKEDNFILSPDGRFLIPIDNDHCFLPSTFQKEGNIWNAWTVNTALQTKTLLFCLDEMNKPVPDEVKQHVLEINFDFVLQSWLQELVKIEDRYCNLVGQEQRNTFLEKGTILRISFYEQFVHNLYWKVNKIQDLLRSPSEPTPLDLLKAVEPFAARCYQESFQHGKTLESRFKAATNKLYNDAKTSRMSILNTQSMMKIIHVSEKDLRNDATYNKLGPSDALELLKQLIQERSQNKKTEQDLLCELDDKSEENFWRILFGNPLLETDLKNFFRNPKEGLILKGSKLITSSNLKGFFAKTPDQGSKIKFLSLPNSPLLSSRTIRTLSEGCPNLEYLNINGCGKLEEIVTRKREWSLLTRLEARDCLNLKKLSSWSPMKILRIGTHQKVIEIFVGKSVLEVFAISTQTNGFDFRIEKGEDFKITTAFSYVDDFLQNKTPLIEKGSFSVDDFLQSALLQTEVFDKHFRSPKITIGSHSISSQADLGIFIASLDLLDFKTSYEKMHQIVQIKFTNLKMLQLVGTSHLGEAQWPSLLENIIKGQWPKLAYLSLVKTESSDEELAILAQGNWPLLKKMEICFPTKITKKGLVNFVCNINYVNLQEIRLPGPVSKYFINKILPKNWNQLEELDLSSSQITQSEIETIVKKAKWPNLKSLNLSNNEISDEEFAILTQGNWPQLEYLSMAGTKITNRGLLDFCLNVKWDKLKVVELPDCIDMNLASSLQTKQLERVERLELNNTKITIDGIYSITKIYPFHGLKYLDISNNEILDEGILLLVQAEWPLLEDLRVENTSITMKGIEAIVNQSKWIRQLKHLRISNNEVFDEGISLLAQAEYPLLEEFYLKNTKITQKSIEILADKMKLLNLRKLDISENKIEDEGLKTLASGKWPLFQHLVYYDTKVTPKGNVALLENSQWPNLQSLEHSLTESFYNYNEDREKWFLPNLILAAVPMYFQKESLFVTVLDATWLNSKEIYVFIKHKNFHGRVMILPRDQLGQLGYIKLSLASFSIIQFIILPSNLKILDLSDQPLSDKKQLEYLFSTKCPSRLEDLNLENTRMTAGFMEILTLKVDLTFLKKLCLAHNPIFDEGLKALSLGNWPILESLNLRSTRITYEGIRSLVDTSKWPNLKALDISNHFLYDRGLQFLSSAGWPELENLNLRNTCITSEGIKSMVEISKWPKLKALNVSDNQLEDQGIRLLSNGEWPLLESLNIKNMFILAQGITNMVSLPNWLNLKTLDVSDNFLDDAGIKALSSGKWPLLENLSLKGTEIGPLGIRSLVKKSNWPKLKVLDLSYCGIYCTGLRFLSSGKWPLLENLNLKSTLIKAFGIQDMVNVSNWPNLKTLDISNNEIYDAGLMTLSSGNWPLLENLKLIGTSVSDEGMKLMVKASKWSHLKKVHFTQV